MACVSFLVMFHHRHGPACPGHLYEHLPLQVARTSRVMAVYGDPDLLV
jgi:hypothetical protein